MIRINWELIIIRIANKKAKIRKIKIMTLINMLNIRRRRSQRFGI